MAPLASEMINKQLCHSRAADSQAHKQIRASTLISPYIYCNATGFILVTKTCLPQANEKAGFHDQNSRRPITVNTRRWQQNNNISRLPTTPCVWKITVRAAPVAA